MHACRRAGAQELTHCGYVCCCAAPGISASPSEDNLRYFNVMILGPTSSPYESE